MDTEVVKNHISAVISAETKQALKCLAFLEGKSFNKVLDDCISLGLKDKISANKEEFESAMKLFSSLK